MQQTIIITSSILCGVLYLLSILMFCGKGGTLIAGYHFSAKGKKAEKYHNFIMRIFGIIILAFTLFLHASLLCVAFKQFIPFGILIGIAVIIVICGIIYMNINPQIQNARKMEKLTDEEIEKLENKR